MGHPQAGWLADHLEHYRRGESGAGFLVEPGGRIGNPSHGAGERVGNPSHGSEAAALYGWSMIGGAGTAETGPVAGPGPATSGPGLLRMAMSAVKSMTRFIGSGGQTVGASTYRQRLQTCAPCEQHTGVRCKVCGCFTSVKAWLPHESRPLGKWPRAATGTRA